MRISVDLDFPTVRDIWKAWEVLSAYGTVMARLSSSRTGVHLKVHGSGVTFAQSLKIRRAAGDDRLRTHYDVFYNGKPRQIMFTEKYGSKATPWTYSYDELLATWCIETGIECDVPISPITEP